MEEFEVRDEEDHVLVVIGNSFESTRRSHYDPVKVIQVAFLFLYFKNWFSKTLFSFLIRDHNIVLDSLFRIESLS